MKKLLLILLLISSIYSQTNKKVTLQLNWLHQFQFAGYYVAKEKGYYNDVNLDVEIKEFKSGINIPKDVKNKTTTFGLANPSLIINQANGDNFIIIDAILQSSDGVLASLASSGINSFKDFKNKKIMITNDDLITSASYMFLLKAQGISLKEDMQLVKHTFNVNDLINGKTDIMAVFRGNELYVLDSLGIKYNTFNPRDTDLDFYDVILFTNQSEVKTNPKMVENFRKASLKGWQYAFENIEETSQIIIDKYNSQNKTKEALIYEAKSLKKLAYQNTNKLGKIEPSRIQRIYDMYNLMGLVKNKIDLKSFIYNKNQHLLSQKEKEYLAKKKLLKFCVNPNWAPLESINSGIHTGISSDYMKLFSERLNIPIKLVKTSSWTESLDNIKQRKCDFLPLASKNPLEEKYLDFTTPYLSTNMVIATKFGIPFIDNLKQIKNKKIGMLKGYNLTHNLHSDFKDINLVSINSIDEGLKKVDNGELFGYLDNSTLINYKIQNSFLGRLAISAKLDYNNELSLATRNDEKLLNSIFIKFFDSISEQTKQTISNRWINSTYSEKIDYTLIWQLLSLFLIIALFTLFWMRKLSIANKKTEELNKEFQLMIDSIMEGIVVFENNKCIDVNNIAMEIYGYTSKDDLIGKAPLFFINTNSDNQTLTSILQTTQEPLETNGYKKDGTLIPLLTKKFILKTYNRTIQVISIIDLTGPKEKEKALNLAKEKAEESTKLKSEFLANMSHEIRTPINGIMGMTTLALKTTLNEQQKHYLKQINGSSSILLNIINDILDFSKIEAKKLTIEKIDFDMSDIIFQLNSILALDAEKKGLEFNINYDNSKNSIFYGDNLRISQILINLTNNAIKFTNIGFVNVSITKSKNNNVRFEISDSGIGISLKNQDKLFESFNQADGTTTRKYGGTGLGLSISKHLVKLMGGDIWVKSEVNKGSKFIFEIPLQHGDVHNIEKTKAIPSNDTLNFQKNTILLVEDNTINQEIILGLLENTKVNIDIANNGEEAVNIFTANESRYELIFMDLQMPIMDGFEATKRIRKINKNIPIIALTANAMKKDTDETKKIGINKHLNKPIEVEKMYDALTEYLK